MVGGYEPITFDELTEIRRLESKNSTLSAIRKDFYSTVQDLLTAQLETCIRLEKDDRCSIIYDGALNKKKRILECLKKIVSIRMNKISQMALIGAMGKDNSVENLTQEEKEYYASVFNASKIFFKLSEKKTSIIRDISDSFASTEYDTDKQEDVTEIDEGVSIADPLKTPIENKYEETSTIDRSDDVSEKISISKKHEELDVGPIKIEKTMVKIIEDLPPFSGFDRDYKLYKEDVVCMPSVLADALINKGKAIAILTV